MASTKRILCVGKLSPRQRVASLRVQALVASTRALANVARAKAGAK